LDIHKAVVIKRCMARRLAIQPKEAVSMVSTVSTPKSKRGEKLLQDANEALRDPAFLYRVSTQIEAAGVVGEKANAQVLFLAALTTQLKRPVSAIVKGPSSSGKSNLVVGVLSMLPDDMVIDRSGLSPKALAYGDELIDRRVLYITELHGAKEGQYLLRLLQSEGCLKYEFATMNGGERETQLVQRSGQIVVITTTTANSIFEDDETRFLSLWSDTSEKQTRAVLLSGLGQKSTGNSYERAVIRKAVSIIHQHEVELSLPRWFETIVEHVPATLRSRRDLPRLISLCKVIALIRAHRAEPEQPTATEVDFADYAVAYRLLNDVFSRTPTKKSSSTDELVTAVETLFAEQKAAVSVREVAKFLGWEEARTYKHSKLAVERDALHYQEGTHANNEKRHPERSWAWRFSHLARGPASATPRAGWVRVCRSAYGEHHCDWEPQREVVRSWQIAMSSEASGTSADLTVNDKPQYAFIG
jgi:hypothetical protein